MCSHYQNNSSRIFTWKIFKFSYFNCLKNLIAHCYKDRDTMGEMQSVQMLKRSSLKSPNGKYLLTLQYDGNFGLYCRFKAIWSVEKTSKEVEARHFESNRNLVIRKKDYSAFWQSGAKGSKATLLHVQDDGNFAIRDYDGNALWNTKTFDKCGKPGIFFLDFLGYLFFFFFFFFFFPLLFFWEDVSVVYTTFKDFIDFVPTEYLREFFLFLILSKKREQIFINIFTKLMSKYRSSHHLCSLRKDVLKIFCKDHRKTPVLIFFLNKAAELQRSCFPVNFDKFLRTPLLQNTSGRLLQRIPDLKHFCKNFVHSASVELHHSFDA